MCAIHAVQNQFYVTINKILELKYKAAIESKKQAVDVELLRQRRVPSIFNIHLGFN